MSTRQTKTPRARAQGALDVAERAVKRLTNKVAGLRAELAEIEHELMLATRRAEYLGAHPDLGDPAQMSLPVEDEGGEES